MLVTICYLTLVGIIAFNVGIKVGYKRWLNKLPKNDELLTIIKSQQNLITKMGNLQDGLTDHILKNSDEV